MSDTHTNPQRIKTSLAYGGLAVALLFSTSFLQLLTRDHVDRYYILASVLAIGTGIIHVKLMQKIYSLQHDGNFGTGLLVSVLVILTSAILSGILYSMLKLNVNFLTSQLNFLVPYMIDQSYRYFLRIPTDKYKYWYYPKDEQLPIIDMINTSETQVLHFVLSKKSTTDTRSSFKIDVPVNIPLGHLFFNLIYNYNKTSESGTIEYADRDGEISGWLFLTEKGGLKKTHFIDPDLSFNENNMKPGSVVYAIRENENEQKYPDVAVSNRMVNQTAASTWHTE